MIKGQDDRAKYTKRMTCEALLKIFLLLLVFLG